MDYDKLYFPKTQMSHVVPSKNCTQETYAAYADSFDLSLLPNDGEVPLSPPSEFAAAASALEHSVSLHNQQLHQQQLLLQQQQLHSQLSPSLFSPPHSSVSSLDYIPTTVYNDQFPIIKSEKPWMNDEDISNYKANQTGSNECNNNTKKEEESKTLLINNIPSALSKNPKSTPNPIANSALGGNQIPSILVQPSQIGTEIPNCVQTGGIGDNSSFLLQQLQKQYQFYPSPLPSPSRDSPINSNSIGITSITTGAAPTIFPPSPCPSIEQNNNYQNFSIKKEVLSVPASTYHTLPPSPPESNGAPSPLSDIKSEPETDTESFIDINSLLEKSLKDFQEQQEQQRKNSAERQVEGSVAQDHQLLREYLQDTSFQKKHNLKPLALESLIGGLGVRSDFEPVISLALEHAKRDAQAMCANLHISPDPQQWTTSQVHAWIRSTIEQFKLGPIDNLEMKFPEDGAALSALTEEEFLRRAPEAGGTIHAQLEIWKLACCENSAFPPMLVDPSTSSWNSGNNCLPVASTDISDDEDEEMPSINTITSTSNENLLAPAAIASTDVGVGDENNPSGLATTVASGNGNNAVTVKCSTSSAGGSGPRTSGSHIHLWQFLKELLASPQMHGTAIRWLDRNKGVFKIEDSVRVAKLWGRRKNRPAMNYDKLSRSIRQYYKKGIMKKTERSQRLVYQFCHPYCL